MSVKEVHDLSQLEREIHEKKFGRFNDFPPNWKPIEENNFWHYFMTYTAPRQEFRQMFVDDKKNKMISAKLYFYSDGTGLALVQQIERAQTIRPLFYQFAACEHTFVSVPSESRMCYHVSKCTKCGYKQEIDSSD